VEAPIASRSERALKSGTDGPASLASRRSAAIAVSVALEVRTKKVSRNSGR
jgi:hypothetical protein